MGVKKRLHIVVVGRCCACILPGYQARSLNLQRPEEGSVVVGWAQQGK
ncbi:hypothetical protein AK972_5648 [Pseudomonas yamanorum]|nr:hypothetical protein AK972_5648 [Pseudomonas yamanorum]